MAKPAPSGTKRRSAQGRGPTPRGTSPKAAARARTAKGRPGGSAAKPDGAAVKPQAATTKFGRGGPKPGGGTAGGGTAGGGTVKSGRGAPKTGGGVARPREGAAEGGGEKVRATPKASGRFTPKGGKAAKAAAPAPVSSGRYTAPIPRNKRSSPPWVPVLLLTLLILGAAVIVLDYLGVLPYGTSAWYLLVGLVLVAGGFGVATQYR
ncbi:MAG: cell division protein CrgA [Acidimicrobiales bacterium]